MSVPPLLIAPLTQGQDVGTVKVTLDGQVVAETALVSLQAQEEAGFFRRSWHNMLLLFE